MFARILDFEIKPDKKEEFVKVVKAEVLPILKKQIGFLEILPFMPHDVKQNRWFTISLWARREDATRYEKEIYPKVQDILKPFMVTPINVQPYVLETRLCEHFVETMAA